jgi:hypothetical protein
MKFKGNLILYILLFIIASFITGIIIFIYTNFFYPGYPFKSVQNNSFNAASISGNIYESEAKKGMVIKTYFNIYGGDDIGNHKYKVDSVYAVIKDLKMDIFAIDSFLFFFSSEMQLSMQSWKYDYYGIGSKTIYPSNQKSYSNKLYLIVKKGWSDEPRINLIISSEHFYSSLNIPDQLKFHISYTFEKGDFTRKVDTTVFLDKSLEFRLF